MAVGAVVVVVVVINVSDHFTRARAQSGGRPGARVYGALLGEQIGRHAEIANSFEMKITTNAAGETRADQEYLRTRLEQYKKNFPKYDMLGWYSTGSEVLPDDVLRKIAGLEKELINSSKANELLVEQKQELALRVDDLEETKVTSVDVTLRKHTAETGAMEFYLEMLPRTFRNIKVALTNILKPEGRLTRHTLVYIGDEKRLPTSDKIVATRLSIKDAWDIRDMAKRIAEYAATYAKNPANDPTLRIQVQCPCPTM